MTSLLHGNTLLLLFVVTAVGYIFGQFSVFGIRLGTVAVLFVGLFFGALVPETDVPQFLPQFGLVIFLFSLGLANGSNFFRAVRRQGRKQILFVLFLLTVPLIVIIPAFFLINVTPAELAGLFAGAATNTASLAGVLDIINSSMPSVEANLIVTTVVVGYSLSYPIGVIGRIVIIEIMCRVWKIDFAAEADALRDTYPQPQEIVTRAVRITQPTVIGQSIRYLQRVYGWDVMFGRLVRQNSVSLVSGETELEQEDIVVVSGEAQTIDEITRQFGEDAGGKILTDQSVYTRRRLFVSNLELVGETVASLDFKEQYGGLITRVRRGDSDVLAHRDTRLEWGDRVRILAPRSEIPRIIERFGDSYQSVSQVNMLSFGAGVTLGLLLGMIQITLPGDINFQLGFAGGVLIMSLLLGALQRTGPIVWTLPYSANQAMQQIGLVLLLAGIGLRSGSTLGKTVSIDAIPHLIIISLIIVVLSTWLPLVIGYKQLNLPFAIVIGMIAAQPAVLSYAIERSKNSLPNVGYAFATPIGIIGKVVLAQLIYIFFSRI